jgi:hypothetical protein
MLVVFAVYDCYHVRGIDLAGGSRYEQVSDRMLAPIQVQDVSNDLEVIV